VHGCPDLISGAMERERVWIPEDGDFTAQTYAAILCTDCFDMCRRLEAMSHHCHANTFAAELDPTLGARVHCRWVVNLACGFGRGPPGSVYFVFATTMMQPHQALHDTVSDSATDSGEDQGDEASD